MLNPIVTLKNGDAADGMKIEALWDAVRDEYARNGFLDMTLTPVPQFDDFAKKVSYNVAINEGTQFRMGKLVLTGLSVEGERRIRAAWGIAPGAYFNKEIYEQILRQRNQGGVRRPAGSLRNDRPTSCRKIPDAQDSST